jgi:hypothetical protein
VDYCTWVYGSPSFRTQTGQGKVTQEFHSILYLRVYVW